MTGSCVPHSCEVVVVEVLATMLLADPDGRRSTVPAASISTLCVDDVTDGYSSRRLLYSLTVDAPTPHHPFHVTVSESTHSKHHLTTTRQGDIWAITSGESGKSEFRELYVSFGPQSRRLWYPGRFYTAFPCVQWHFNHWQ